MTPAFHAFPPETFQPTFRRAVVVNAITGRTRTDLNERDACRFAEVARESAAPSCGDVSSGYPGCFARSAQTLRSSTPRIPAMPAATLVLHSRPAPRCSWTGRVKFCHSAGMVQDLTPVILQVLQRAPQWIRHDLEAKDPPIRVRAEETLAAMISNALEENGLGTSARANPD